MRVFIIATAAAIGALTATAPAGAFVPTGNAAKVQTSNVIPAAYYHRRHYYRHGGWVPPRLRGFQDPGYAYHGNLNGCAVDLGYGRWESCDVGR